LAVQIRPSAPKLILFMVFRPYQILKESIYDDKVDRFLLLIGASLGFLDWYIWHRYLETPDIYVYTKLSIYPVRLLAVIILINLLLAISSYQKEKEISYLLFVGIIIAEILVLALEIYYLRGA
jgi:hypothetical protein